MKSAVILISGRGSNMQALVEATPGLDFRAVISNRPEAKGLAWAAAQGIATRTVDHQSHATREAFDAALTTMEEHYRGKGVHTVVGIESRGFIFGAPLAIEGLLAFFLESTFIGLWIFGWGRLSRGLHLTTIWLAARTSV